MTKLAQSSVGMIRRWKIICPSMVETIDHEAEASWIATKAKKGKRTKVDSDYADDEEVDYADYEDETDDNLDDN